jgi:Flp pilus assembly protein TadG
MMHKSKANRKDEGVVAVVVALLLLPLLLLSGLAIDLGRAYLVKVQLTKAVDGASLAAARAMGSGMGTPEKDAATRIFKANFKTGYLGTSSVTDPATDPTFFNKVYDPASGANIITLKAQATLPMTFMRLAGFNQITVGGSSEARLRNVDLSLAIDCSGSLGSDWSAVRDAARRFINSFDAQSIRVAVTLFSDGAHVAYPMPATLNYTNVKSDAMAAIPNNLPGTYTSMADGFYRAWDEIRSVPYSSQSGLRIIILFTDGTPNGTPGYYQYKGGTSYYREVNTDDFPSAGGTSTNNPSVRGLTPEDCTSGPNCAYSPLIGTNGSWTPGSYTSTTPCPDILWLPATSYHQNHHPSGILYQFPFSSSSLTVNGVAQSTARPLTTSAGRYPANIPNLNNAARNLLEIIADAARSDASGQYPIRIYSIGMGDLVNYSLGTLREKGSDILKRIANDATSADYNSAQKAGKYFYAATASDVDPAFQAVRNEILRLSR